MNARRLASAAWLACALVAVDASAQDPYFCYRAGLAKGRPKLPRGLSKALEDALGGPQTFDVRRIAALCNPVDRDGSGIANPTVHLESFTIKAQRGGPKFVKSDRVTVDQFAQRTLTITGPAALLDVTPKALGSTPPAAFASDPTADPAVNRFKCYRAKLAKGSPKFVAPAPPTLTDQFFAGGQAFVVTKVTKLCKPVDKDGETPGAETRPTALVCYAVKLPKGAPRFAKPTVATNAANFAPHVLVARAPAELCMPATEPTATPTPTSTATATPTASATVTATPTATPTASATVSPSPSETLTASATFTPSPTATPSATSTPTVVVTPAKRVFVTSTATNGGFGGVSGGDAICTARASTAGLPGTFRAWVSVTGDGPATRFTQSASPYGLVDGTIVAADWSDLTDGTLAHPIDRDENGNVAHFPEVWTGTDAAGTPAASNCNDFADSTASFVGVCGTTGGQNSNWTNAGTPTCNTSTLRLYCFEQ